MSYTDNANDVINISEVLGVLWKYKVLIIISMLVFGATFVFYAKFVRTSAVTAKMTLAVKTDNQSEIDAITNSLKNNSVAVNTMDKSVANQIQVLKSNTVLGEVVKKLQLDNVVSAHYFPVIGRHIANSYQTVNYQDIPNSAPLGLDHYNWGGAKVNITQFEVGPAWVGKRFELEYLGNDRYMIQDNGTTVLTAKLGENAGFFKDKYQYLHLNIKSINANAGAMFNLQKASLNEAINQLQGGLSVSSVDKNSDFLSLSYRAATAKEALMILQNIAQSAIHFSLVEQQKQASKILTFLLGQLPITKRALETAQKKYNAYQKESGNISFSDSSKLLLQRLNQTDINIANMQLKIEQLEQVFTKTNPELLQLQSTLKEMKALRNHLQTEVKNLPDTQKNAIQLQRDVDVQTKIYQNIQELIQNYTVLKAGALPKLQIIDVPFIVQSHKKPTALFLALGMFLGAFLASGMLFVWRFVFHGINTFEEVEQLLGLKNLAVLPLTKPIKRKYWKLPSLKFSYGKNLKAIAVKNMKKESFKALALQIAHQLKAQKNKVITISGPTSGVGKSFIAANVAKALSQKEMKVLLIDGDSKAGGIANYFEKNNLKKSCDNASKIDVYQTNYKCLDYIPSEVIAESEYLLKEGLFEKWMEELSLLYDVIIIDTPAILAVNDAIEIMQSAVMNMLVLAEGKHSPKQVQYTMAKLSLVGVKVEGFIFNMATNVRSYFDKGYKYV